MGVKKIAKTETAELLKNGEEAKMNQHLIPREAEEKTEDLVVTVDTEPTAEPEKVEVVIKETETVTKKEQMSKIRMRVDHDCYIGGEWYRLKADSVYNVAENVKRILNDAGLLAPL